MMTRTERMKLLVQAIGADIKAITDKTNLLKTAAYKDVGTTAGTVPEFVGNEGMGGFGFGGYSKNLGTDVNLDTLPKVNAIYAVAKNNVVVGLPADMQTYRYNSEMTLQVLTSTNEFFITQILTAIAYRPPDTSIRNPVIFTRCGFFDDWGPWGRVSGQLMGVDIVDEEVIGDDLVVNSIKAGVTSPSVSFEVIRKDITYTNASYNADGSRPNAYTGGRLDLKTTIHPNRILSMTARVYSDIFGSQYEYMAPKYSYSNAYYEILSESNGVILMVQNESHAEQDGVMQHNGQNLFDKPSYIELFITYKAK